MACFDLDLLSVCSSFLFCDFCEGYKKHLTVIRINFKLITLIAYKNSVLFSLLPLYVFDITLYIFLYCIFM